MIELINITKLYRGRFGTKTVLKNISMKIRQGEKIGILGRNGSGKSTLIKIISGMESQTSGKIIRNLMPSWPIALSGGIQGTLTGIDNLNFICRIYGQSIDEKRSLLEEMTGLGSYLREPVANYSSGMKARLALGISLLIDFDFYLIDEALSIGDKAFQDQFKGLLDSRLEKGLILVSHNELQIKQYCDNVVVLHQGEIHNFINNQEAFNFYKSITQAGKIEIK